MKVTIGFLILLFTFLFLVAQMKPAPMPIVVVATPTATPVPTGMSFDDFNQMLLDRGEEGIFATPAPSKKPVVTQEKVQVAAPDTKVDCWVDKNGSYEMTWAECKGMYDADPEKYNIRAYHACVGGHNPVVGSEGTPDSRKQKCSDLTGVEEIK